MKSLFVSGIILGLSAGLSPGPMLTLVLSQTLKHGILEGIKVSLAPLLTDIPIIIVCLLILRIFSSMSLTLGLLSVVGGIYLFYLGISSLRFKEEGLKESQVEPKSLQKGLMVNFLNPNPYMFWSTIGGPLVLKASDTSILAGIVFMVPFYVLLVGSKVGVAVISGRSKNFLKSRYYKWVIQALGLVLVGFGVLFLRDGWRYLMQ